MATILKAAGEQVGLLCLIDSCPPPKSEPGAPSVQSVSLLEIAHSLYGGDFKTECRTLSSLCDRLRQENRLPYFFGEQYFRLILENMSRAELLTARFVPAAFNGNILVFVGTEGKPDPQSIVETWRPYINGIIETHYIACSHGEMFDEDSLAKIGPLLESELGKRP